MGSHIDAPAAAISWICGVDVAGGEVDSAAGVGQEGGGKLLIEGVEDGKFDAVVGGDAADVEAGDSLLAKIGGVAGALAVAVVVETTVAVDGGVGAFAKDGVDASGVEVGGKVGSVVPCTQWVGQSI